MQVTVTLSKHQQWWIDSKWTLIIKESVTYSSFDFRPIILGVKVFCRKKDNTLEIDSEISSSAYYVQLWMVTFLTPPSVRSLERIVGRRPGEMEAGSRRPIGNPLAPPTCGARGGALGSPEPSILTDPGTKSQQTSMSSKCHMILQAYMYKHLQASSEITYRPLRYSRWKTVCE